WRTEEVPPFTYQAKRDRGLPTHPYAAGPPITKGGWLMRLSRWQPLGSVWNELQQLQREMNRVFERWGEDGGRMLGLTAPFPAVNVWEDSDTVFVEAELPGLDLKDLEIYVTGGNQLTIKGERKPPALEKGVWHRQERGFGAFTRTLT